MFPRVNFTSPGCGARGFAGGSFAGIVLSGGFVTAVSGGRFVDVDGAVVQETTRKVSRNEMVEYFILTPVCDCREDVPSF
jgi:hypothetical protein